MMTTERRSLVTPWCDFWLLGGASLVVWLVIVGTSPFRDHVWAIDHHFKNLAALSATLSLVVNFPHFMASYKLAYSQGLAFMRRWAFQLLVVPVGLFVILVQGYLSFESGSKELGLGLQSLLNYLGLYGGNLGDLTSGAVICGLMINVMYITVGWHYSKQVYGCMMVYAAFDDYPLTPWQRRLLRWTNHGVWAVNFFYLNSFAATRDYYGLKYLNLGFSNWFYYGAQALFVGLFVAAFVFVFVRNYRLHGKRPSAQFLVPFIAFPIWWVPPLLHNDFMSFVAPFFHSLQYLPFVFKVEKSRLLAHGKNLALWGTLLPLSFVVTGFLFFELIPNQLDLAYGFYDLNKAWYCFAAFHVFINVHHYFLDNAIWRLQDSRLKEHLGLSKT